MEISKKVIWITGASSGIGKALALEYSKLEVILILSSRNSEELQQVKKECENQKDIFLFNLDVTDFAQQEIVYREIVSKFGSIDILINNAGISQRCEETETPMELYRELMEVNYFAVVSLTKLVLKNFREKNEGLIVNITSIAGLFGISHRTGYCASKFAVEGFFLALEKELLKTKIKILMIQPIWITSNISQNALIGNNTKFQIEKDSNKDAMSSTECAKKIIQVIKKGKKQKIIGKNNFRNFFIKRYKITPKFILNYYNI